MNGYASRDGRTQVNHQLFGKDSALLLGSDQRFKPRNPAWASCRRGEKQNFSTTLIIPYPMCKVHIRRLMILT